MTDSLSGYESFFFKSINRQQQQVSDKSWI